MIPLPLSTEALGTKRVLKEDEANAELFLHINVTRLTGEEYRFRLAQEEENELVDRAHTQILMPVGTPTKLLCDLLELIRCFRGCVEDHCHAHNNLIIHRDVSIANLLIYPPRLDGGETFGRLIDFHHAKKAVKFIPLPSSGAPDWRHDFFKAYNVHKGHPCTDDAVAEALRFINSTPAAIIYTEAAIKSRFGSQKGLILTAADLGWDHCEGIRWPDFSDRKARKEERSGTLPFISVEVLQGATLRLDDEDDEDEDMINADDVKLTSTFSHNFVHDMESFLWVLIYLCLTRSGPGIGMLREELNPSHEKYASRGELAKAILKYFDDEELTLTNSKRSLFSNRKRVFETAIVRLFHPYFEPLKPLVRQWWATLKLAYGHHGNEYYHVHAHTLRLLEDTLSVLQTRTDLGQEAATTCELECRESLSEPLQIMAKLAPAMNTITPSMSIVAPQTTPEYHRISSSSNSTIPADSPTRRPAIKKRRVA
ncbi:hypothetical protein D9615_007849 [Tricholomella constricta]|uniref:Fungal-type protein kinase domain-containing protein n=1 Tax=Tricholomella constricta TaxID=117010 RepID=A0A8H5H517_9AGAR|nr:hypothetical protein D9615_007849 [Tricholomella constricta]